MTTLLETQIQATEKEWLEFWKTGPIVLIAAIREANGEF